MRLNSRDELKSRILSAVEKAESAAILTHIDPDGDGFCAALALQALLSNSGKPVEIVLEEQAPDLYEFVDGAGRSLIYHSQLSFELLLILDCHETDRLGKCAKLVDKAQDIIAVDHHLPGKFIPQADTYIDPGSVSVGAIIFRMFQTEFNHLDPEVSQYIATCIYTTIINDTDNFINPNVDRETFLIAAELLNFGIEPGVITENLLMKRTAAEMRYIGHVLTTINTWHDGQIMFLHTTEAMLRADDLSLQANRKILRWVKGAKGVKIFILFQEVAPEVFRLSFRSPYLPVDKIAQKFGGGGHQKAAGCQIQGSLAEVQQIILKELETIF